VARRARHQTEARQEAERRAAEEPEARAAAKVHEHMAEIERLK
jgi:hypothetical protein